MKEPESQPLSTHGVHAGPNLEHTDADATDATNQPQPGKMDEEFTTTAYPNVQENLKLTVDKPITADTEAESMVSVTIHQDTSAISPMTSPVIDLVSRPDSPNHIGELEQHIADLVEANLALKERLDKHGSRLYMLENQDIPNQVRKAVDEISWWKPITKDIPVTPEPAWSIPSSALTVPTNNWASALKSTYTPPPENSLLAQIGDMATFMDWYCKKQGISKLTQKDLEGPAYEIVQQCYSSQCSSSSNSNGMNAINFSHRSVTMKFPQYNVTTLPRVMGRPALSISKMKAAYYPDVGLEQMVPDQMWIEEECKYDVATMDKYWGSDNMRSMKSTSSVPVLYNRLMKRWITESKEFMGQQDE
ncbi:hypothetical protein Tco_0032632 [Tanacetum coccineum]